MNELCFTVVVLNLNKFLTIDFNRQSSMCARQMLCLNCSDLQERRKISKLYMIAKGHWFPVYGLGNEYVWRHFLQEKDVPTEISSVEIKYLGTNQSRRRQLFCRLDNAFSQYSPAFASVIVASTWLKGRPYIYYIYFQICL